MVAGYAFVPACLLALTMACVVIVRSRPTVVKLSVEIVMLALIGGALLVRGTSPLPVSTELIHAADASWLRALGVVWWLIAARMIATLVALGLGHDARSRQARLFSDLLAGGIYITAALIILNSVLDLPIKGVLATSGVLAIVLGLALQNTLGDVFSGIAFGVEQPFHVGDRITISDHAEGVVVEMNWRAVRIQTDGEDVATIPNSIVARSRIINHSVPTERRAISLDIPTLSSARSEHLLTLVRQAILLCPAIMVEPAPNVVIKYVGTRHTTIGVNFFIEKSSALTPAKSQLLRQVRRLFRHAGVYGGQTETSADLIQGVTLFETLSIDQIQRLATGTIVRSFDRGGVLFEQGSHGASLYIIRSGIFEISQVRPDGSLLVYGRIGPGEYLGEISMMSGDPRPVTVAALAAASVLELPRTALEALLEEDKELSAALELSVQRGLALLDRDDAARECHPLDHDGSILGRIRAFLYRTKRR